MLDNIRYRIKRSTSDNKNVFKKKKEGNLEDPFIPTKSDNEFKFEPVKQKAFQRNGFANLCPFNERHNYVHGPE